ncbi:MAG: hypothetical protein JWM82_2992 [Myxococcales bacterium]|nr:hypothetical protein [Myxococcales bacterium]
MTTEPRASERAAGDPSARRLRDRLRASGALAIVLVVSGVGACRQTVLLDATERGSDASVSGSDGGAGDGLARSDGPRFERPPGFCMGGQIVPLLVTMRVPDLVFAVDHSAAMQSPFGGTTGMTGMTTARIQAVQQAVKALIGKYQRVVHFGYEEFPSSSGTCGSSGCCAGDVVPPAPNTAQAIDHVMRRCDGNLPGCAQSQRPLANALDKCGGTFSSFPNDSGARYVIALVGGDPTCQGPDPGSAPCADAIGAVTRLSRASVRSTLFGVGAETAGSDCLDQIALQSGLEVAATSPYYHLARSPSELTAELEPLMRTIAEESCHIDILTPPADPDKVSVLFDGAPVNIDAVNGWTFNQDSTVGLTLHGAACDTLVAQSPRVEVITGCSSPRH